MKNILLIFILLIFIIDAKSQLIPGSFTIKGSTGLSGSGNVTTISSRSTFPFPFSDDSNSESESSNFNLGAQLGFTPTHHINFGINLGWTTQNNEREETSQKIGDFIIGPYLRVYLTKFKLNPFIQSSIGLENYKISQTEYSTTKDYNFNGYRFVYGGGLEYFVSKNFSMEMQIDHFSSSLDSYEEGNGNSQFSYSTSGWGLRFGFTILINSGEEIEDNNIAY